MQNHYQGIDQVIPDSFDSRKVGANGSSEHSAIHVIKDPRQILPFCVIILKVFVSYNVWTSTGLWFAHGSIYLITLSFLLFYLYNKTVIRGNYSVALNVLGRQSQMTYQKCPRLQMLFI